MANPPKPPHLKSISGTERPDRKPDTAIPEYEVLREFPAAPQHLTVDGADMWAKLGPQLVACGVLQIVDLYGLEQLCFAWQRFRKKCKADLEYTASEDNALAALLGQFGLTPAARRRVVANLSETAAKNRFAKNGKR